MTSLNADDVVIPLPDLIATIRRYRLDQDLTYEKLADTIGISRAALSYILRGEAAPYERTHRKLTTFVLQRRLWRPSR